MAVITVADVTYRKFSGYQQPELPTGFWVGAGIVTGVGGGGDMVIQIDFVKATSLRDSQYYSLEEVMIELAAATAVVGRFAITNMGIFNPVTASIFTLPLVVHESVGAALQPEVSNGLRGLFLGQQSNPNAAVSISYGVDDLSGSTMSMKLGGYVWSARATNVPGGPQRPAGGLYRQ